MEARRNFQNYIVHHLLQSCGFGCQLHTLAQCFTLAYGFQRTLLVSTEDWNYNVGPKGWEFAFQPVSETCRQTPDQESVFWRGNKSNQTLITILANNFFYYLVLKYNLMGMRIFLKNLIFTSAHIMALKAVPLK